MRQEGHEDEREREEIPVDGGGRVFGEAGVRKMNFVPRKVSGVDDGLRAEPLVIARHAPRVPRRRQKHRKVFLPYECDVGHVILAMISCPQTPGVYELTEDGQRADSASALPFPNHPSPP